MQRALPCWVGEDPDNKTCDTVIAWGIDEGTIDGIGSRVEAEMAPFIGATGNPTTLAETVFSTIPGSPVYATKASGYTRDGSGHGIPSVDLKDNNALQGHFRFAA